MSIKNNIYDIVHRGCLISLAFITGTLIYDGAYGFYSTRQRRLAWQESNPDYEDDPFYMYNANFMRFNKKTEEDIILCRPQFYAAKELREKENTPLQYPFIPINGPLLDMDGNPLNLNNDVYQKISDQSK